MRADDDILAGGDERNNFWDLGAFYTVPEKILKRAGIPGVMVVPAARLDGFEKSGGDDEFLDLTLNLGSYPWEKMRVYAEHFRSIDRPPGKAHEWRWTVQVEFSF
ncbi:MAG: hypothetical protein ACE5H5_03500 [Nitrospinota bacterium]